MAGYAFAVNGLLGSVHHFVITLQVVLCCVEPPASMVAVAPKIDKTAFLSRDATSVQLFFGAFVYLVSGYEKT